jgi:squalene cyclase
MQRAREVIVSAGGADGVDAATRCLLAMLGQIPYEHCPALPAELAAQRPVTALDPRRGIRELFLKHPREWPAATATRSDLPWPVCREQLDALVQPCQSPARDTALALSALLEAGVRSVEESIVDAVRWLHEQQPSHNDEIALVATAMQRLLAESSEECVPSGLQLLTESLEPSGEVHEHASAILARIQSMLAADKVDAIERFRQSQEPDGSWPGTGGINYIHGTWQALAELTAVGLPADDPMIAAGVNWLLAWQQACGGWGESPASLDNPRLRGQGPVTASQTSWALLGLMAAGLSDHPAVTRGVRFLVSEQSDDGTWHEPEFTRANETGVYRCDLDRCCFPLLALSRWLRSVVSGQ